jgi:hypothetical protein
MITRCGIINTSHLILSDYYFNKKRECLHGVLQSTQEIRCPGDQLGSSELQSVTLSHSRRAAGL